MGFCQGMFCVLFNIVKNIEFRVSIHDIQANIMKISDNIKNFTFMVANNVKGDISRVHGEQTIHL